jgi:uncharacterized cupin superfamily protein
MISNSSTDVALNNSPINAEWILEGNPVARNRVISRGSDSLACTIVWDCTAGKFNWFYDVDETVHVIEGSVIVSDGQSPPKRLVPGSVAFFPAGTKAHWHVEKYVRKVAFCQRTLPSAVQLSINLLRHVLTRFRGKAATGSLMDAGEEAA